MSPDRPIIGLTMEESVEYVKLTQMTLTELLQAKLWEQYIQYVHRIAAACGCHPKKDIK